MRFYADSSFLMALMIEDANSAAAQRFMAKNPEALPFNPLHRLEVRNGIRLRAYRKEIDAVGSRAALRQIDDDLADGILVHDPMPWTNALRKAEELGAAHTERTGNRAADILHVAAALLGGADTFLSFDKRQRTLAKASGLPVKP